MNKRSVEQKYNLPLEIRVSIKKAGKGGLIIRLPDYSGAVSYAEHGGEVVNIVNDLILTYFNVPREEASKVNFTYLPDASAVKKQKEAISKSGQKPGIAQRTSFIDKEVTSYYTPFSYA